MADVFLTPQELTWESLRILRNNCIFFPELYDALEGEFGEAGHKRGDTLMVRKPVRYVATNGPQYQPQAIVETQTPVVVNQYTDVHFEFTSTEKKLSLDNFSKRHVYPATVALGDAIDFACSQALALQSFQTVGTPGTTPSGANAFQTYLSAPAQLRRAGFPQDGLTTLVINPTATVQIVDTLKGVFNPQATVGGQYKRGMMGTDTGGSDWYESNHCFNLVTGVYATAGTVTGSQSAAGGNNATMSLLTGSWTSLDQLNTGDVFTIGTQATGVHSVDPQTRQSTGVLQQFVVLATSVATGGGVMTTLVAPAITPSGQYQNVDVAAGNGMQITPYQDNGHGAAASAINTHQLMCFHRDAMAVGSVPLDIPKHVDMGFQDKDDDIGIAIRLTRTWDPVHDLWPVRLDVLWFNSPLYREGGVRIASS